MTESNDKKLKRVALEIETGDDSSSGSGGSGRTGAIQFRDFVLVHEEKKLSPVEEKQFLMAHKEANSGVLEKQRKLREQRKDRKEKRTLAQAFGMGNEAVDSSFLKHPILSNAAEFDGADPEVNPDPTIYDADTNDEKKQELTYQHQLRLRLQNEPSHTPPKPSPFG